MKERYRKVFSADFGQGQLIPAVVLVIVMPNNDLRELGRERHARLEHNEEVDLVPPKLNQLIDQSTADMDS